MVDRLISFAAPGDPYYGAIALGGNGEADLVGGYISGPQGGIPIEDAAAGRGEGTLRVSTGSGDLVLGLAAHTSALGFGTGPDRGLTVQAVGASVDGEGSSGGFEANGVAWKIEGEQDQSALRTIWSTLGDGSLLVLFSLRPPGSDEHGTETVGAARIAKDGNVTSFGEPLLSTEYDGDGQHTRATLELWGDDEGGPATRGGGLRSGGGRGTLGGATLEAARFDWRVDGNSGFGGYEILRS